jgi:hypothetical protein
MNDHHIPLREFAAKLGVAYSTAARWCALGELPAEKYAGQWRIERAELERRVAEKREAMRVALAALTAGAADAPEQIRAATALHADDLGARVPDDESIDDHLAREYPGYTEYPAELSAEG